MVEIEPVDPLFDPHEIGTIPKPREMTLTVGTLARVRDLNHRWHSRLPDTRMMQASDLVVPYLLTSGAACFGVALWTRPMAANRMVPPVTHYAELRRQAIAPYAPFNSATRFLGLMRKDLRTRYDEICTLISYQDTGSHVGTIYKADNWTSSDLLKFVAWDNPGAGRSHRPAEHSAPKIRWSYQLRRCDVH
jgi:hypothetical protein